MIITGDEVVAFPLYILERYSDLGISDKDLLTIQTFLSVQLDGKELWDRVARIRGYRSDGYLKPVIDKLEQDGLVIVSGWNLDFSPLFQKCRGGEVQGTLKVDLLASTKDVKPKKKHYNFYKEIQHIVPAQSEHAWNEAAKKLIEEYDSNFDEIKCFVQYLHSYYLQTSKGPLPRKASPYDVKYFIDWRERGRPKEYVPQEQKNLTSLRDKL